MSRHPFERRRTAVGLVLFALGAAGSGACTSRSAALPDVARRIDGIVSAPIRAGKLAGAAIAVDRRGAALVRKAYGLADLEWNVPMPADASFEIGSVTKQFTAAAILLLAERGRLSLDDEVTKFLPSLSTHGAHITIRHLLTHTSGIPGYTELPEWDAWSKRKQPRDQLLALIGERPLDFNPGDALVYDNSGYFLLGLIIEKASGAAYEDFVRANLFDKAGMSHSYYCSESVVHPHHAHGYEMGTSGLVQRGFIDHTWPYAAGSLCSTADDLSAWLRALHGGAILRAESYRAMTTGATLADGTPTRYGFGLAMADIAGRPAIAHGGSINGFRSATAYFPSDDVSIVVLLNSGGVDPLDILIQIENALLGPPVDRSQPFPGDLHAYEGDYEGLGRGRRSRVTISANGGVLSATDRSAPAARLRALEYFGHETFGYDSTRLTFQLASGHASQLRLDTVYGYVVLHRTAGD
jgi:CubicO group peptidase (beta-lactamase class C family)